MENKRNIFFYRFRYLQNPRTPRWTQASSS